MEVFALDDVARNTQALPTQLTSPNVNQTSFGDFLAQEIAATNTKIVNAESTLQQFALGEADNLHQVMMTLEKAKLSFEFVTEVRNKVLEGFQDVMRMSI